MIFWISLIAGALLGAILQTLIADKVESAWTYLTGNLARDKNYTLNGIWRSTYTYTSSAKQGVARSTCFIIFKKSGKYLTGSTKKVHQGSEIYIKGKIEQKQNGQRDMEGSDKPTSMSIRASCT